LHPVAIVHSLTIADAALHNRHVNASIPVQTYFTQKATDGHTAVFLLDQFFNQQIFNVVANEINAGRFTTGALTSRFSPIPPLLSERRGWCGKLLRPGIPHVLY